MIKRKRKVIAALLVAATVLASGTFAYFNAKVDFSGTNVAKGQNTLNITNGKVEIGALIGDAAIDDYTWSYDVARLSTTEDLINGRLNTTAADTITSWLEGSTATDAGFYNGTNVEDAYLGTGKGADYVKKNLSPDILGLSTDGDRDTKKAQVGDQVVRAISNARPGDAFVLGNAADKTKQGLKVVNNSNLTTNIRIRLVNTEDALNQFKSLINAGWQLYINGENVTKAINTEIVKGGVTTDKIISEVNKAFEKVYTSVKPNTNVSTEDGANTEARDTAKFEVRLELPLATTNSYQEKTTTETGLNEGFDIRNIFEIVATQDNNPGWNEDGSESNPVTTDSTTKNNQ